MRGRSAPRAERFRTKMLSATKVGGGCNLGRSVEERKGGREGGREAGRGSSGDHDDNDDDGDYEMTRER